MATFNTITWTPLTPISSSNLQIMMDNTQYLKDTLTSYPLGVIAAGRCTASFSGVSGTPSAIPGMACSGTIGTGRCIKVTWNIRSINPTTSNNVYQTYVTMGGTVIGRINVLASATAYGQGGGTGTCIVNNPTSGAYSFQAYIQAVAGTGTGSTPTGTATFEVGPDSYPILVVEDIGPYVVGF